MPYAKKKQLICHLKNLQAEVVIVDIGAGTSYHAGDFFLMADHHVTVATPDPTSVLDLYRFIKLAAIRRVSSSFLARGAIAHALSDRDFSSVEEVLDVVGQTDETSHGVAETALRTFHPTLILNRLSGRAYVNVATLKKILEEYIGGDLTLLGEVPDDPAMERAGRGSLPVVHREPDRSRRRGARHHRRHPAHPHTFP